MLDRVLDDLSARHGDEVELTADHYWVIDPQAAYDLSATPSIEQLTVGQLADDLAEVAALSAATDPPFPWHDLGHVIGILQRLAAQDLP
ncbi:hypothetical protein GCU67_19540 [Modestobacter muralis]|uniref:Uncharacterized protein n=1 Tax=Modestobacter muralis TaxID=1608614 RepID=A0A6P0EXA9_9ACTN|nr:hypothetical protein [Modestobacter muralis]NEK96341.1 hypothetical protein [Modestobacter muralis]NEN53241.1 hypothetical protein [Modestobacter muralis]